MDSCFLYYHGVAVEFPVQLMRVCDPIQFHPVSCKSKEKFLKFETAESV